MGMERRAEQVYQLLSLYLRVHTEPRSSENARNLLEARTAGEGCEYEC